MADRRHHHHNNNNNNYLYSHSSSRSRSRSSLLSSSSNTSKSAAVSVASLAATRGAVNPASALFLPPASSPVVVDDDAAVAVAVAAASSSSKKKLKILLKLPNKSQPASPSTAFSSPSSDPYGSSPPSQQFSDRHATSSPSPKPSSVTSAPKKIPSSNASLPTSHRSALPLPAVVAAQVSPATVASPVPTSVPFAAASVARATGVPSTPAAAAFSLYRAHSATSASVSAFAVAGEDEGDQKLSKKRRLKAVAAAAVVAAHQLHQGKPLHPARLGLISHTSSDLPLEKPQVKIWQDKGSEDDAGAKTVSRLIPELIIQPLVSKKILEGVVEKLQRKDTFGVFSEPVDPKEVPDYYDIIKDPMDFGTVQKKIAGGAYVSLELFQKDIFLICSNAMRYNAKDTVYYKQARSIQETARRTLEALRAGTILVEEQNVSLKQRPGGLSMKKSMKKPPSGRLLFEPTGSDYTSGATLATGGESGAWLTEAGKSGKGITQEKSGCAGWNPEPQAKKGCFGEDQQDDIAGSLSKCVVLKDGRRPPYDENRRNTYMPRNIQIHENGLAFLSLGGEHVQLVPMAYQQEYAYARSLSRFAADLGPAAWRVAAEKIQNALPPGLSFGPGWVGEQEASAGVPQHLNKERAQLSQQMQVKGIQNTDNKQLDLQVQAAPVASRDTSLKFPAQLQSSSTNQVTPGLAHSVNLTRTVCQPTEEAMAVRNCSMPAIEPADITKEPSRTHIQLNAAEPIKLTLGGANFSTDVSQSKLLEMVSQNSRLMPWASGKPSERVPLSSVSQSHLYSAEQSVHEKNFEVHNTNWSSNISSSVAPGVADFSKQVFLGQGGRGVWSGGSQNSPLQNSNLSSPAERQQTTQTPLKQTPHFYLSSTHVPQSIAFSSADTPSVGAASGRDDRRMPAWAHSQPINLSHIGSNGRGSLQNQPSGNTIQNQLGGASQIASQQYDTQTRQQLGGASQVTPQYDTQTRLGHQQHEYQARSASQQHDNQRLLSVPQFLQHQFPNDTPSFVQQQLVRLHQQGASKPIPPLVRSGNRSNCDLQDSNLLNLQSCFPAPMVAGVHPSLNQPWRFVSLQYPFQQGANLSHSLPPDLNVSLQTPKSPLDQPSNSLTDSQQPDLALQL